MTPNSSAAPFPKTTIPKDAAPKWPFWLTLSFVALAGMFAVTSFLTSRMLNSQLDIIRLQGDRITMLREGMDALRGRITILEDRVDAYKRLQDYSQP